jgi:RNA polymerase sigma-70 factor (ECF subfamily)
MSQEPNILDPELERNREFLRILARKHLDRRLWSKIDPSDVVQKTLLSAHEKREQIRGSDPLPWLVTALRNDVRDAIRDFGRIDAKERAFQQAVDESVRMVHSWAVADVSSPSQRAMKQEELLRLVQALVQLPEAERIAVELHHLNGWSVAEVADQLQRTEPAVAGLLHRGLKRLRNLMQESE